MLDHATKELVRDPPSPAGRAAADAAGGDVAGGDAARGDSAGLDGAGADAAELQRADRSHEVTGNPSPPDRRW
jgi:hypothetical protein